MPDPPLDPEPDAPDPGPAEAWAAEIEERVRRYEAGETRAIPAVEVLRDLRELIRSGAAGSSPTSAPGRDENRG